MLMLPYSKMGKIQQKLNRPTGLIEFNKTCLIIHTRAKGNSFYFSLRRSLRNVGGITVEVVTSVIKTFFLDMS